MMVDETLIRLRLSDSKMKSSDSLRRKTNESGAPKENIVQNHLNIAFVKRIVVTLNGRYRHIFIR